MSASKDRVVPIDLFPSNDKWTAAFWVGHAYRAGHLFLRRERPSRWWIGAWALPQEMACEWTATPKDMRTFSAALSPAAHEQVDLHLGAYDETRSVRGTLLHHEDGDIYYFAGPTLDDLWDWMDGIRGRVSADMDAERLGVETPAIPAERDLFSRRL